MEDTMIEGNVIEVKEDGSHILPPLSMEDLDSLQGKEWVSLEKTYGKDHFLTWTASHTNEDPWFQIVNADRKVYFTLAGKAEFDDVYEKEMSARNA
jgi:hypothetical protein